MAKELHRYVLCKQWQDKRDGHLIETDIDMDACKNFEAFLKKLHTKKLITDEELETIDSSYYADMI